LHEFTHHLHAPLVATTPLRRLLRDPSVPDAQYKSCMERMLASAQKLSGLLHGQAVRGRRFIIFV